MYSCIDPRQTRRPKPHNAELIVKKEYIRNCSCPKGTYIKEGKKKKRECRLIKIFTIKKSEKKKVYTEKKNEKL